VRSIFLGYYLPTEKEFKKLWEEGCFVLDTNVLLNLYQYSRDTLNLWFDVLEQFKTRIWIPHQVALEYQENRLSKISEQTRMYETIKSKLEDTLQVIEVLLSEEHPSIQKDELMEGIRRAFSEAEHYLTKAKEGHPDLFSKDEIREKIDSLFDGKVGEPLPSQELENLYKDGEKRYKHGIPPGYKDAKKGRDRVKRYGNLVLKDIYGDLILWYQIIGKAIESKRPIVFITGDKKEDWWWIYEGRTIGPRPELRTEMMQKAGMLFYMYRPERFIEIAAQRLGIEKAEGVIEETKKVGVLSWKEEIIEALQALEGEATLAQIYEYVESHTSRDLNQYPHWQAAIRGTLQAYSSDASDKVFRGQDLFHRVSRGRWALRNRGESDNSDADTSGDSPTMRAADAASPRANRGGL